MSSSSRPFLYMLETGATGAAGEDLTPEPVAPPGSDADDPGPRYARMFSMYRDETFLDPRPRGLPSGTSWAEDAAALRLRVAQARLLADIAGGTAGPLASVEESNFRKFCLQLGALPGWDVIPDGIERPGDEAPIQGLDVIMDMVKRAAVYPLSQPIPAPYPRISNVGWPLLTTSPKAKVALAALVAGSRDCDHLTEGLAEVANIAETFSEPVITLFSRTGPLGKFAEVFEFRGRDMHRVAKAKGVAPRRRHVYGVPTAYNLVIQPYQQTLKKAIQNTRMFGHGTRAEILAKILDDVRLVGRGARIIADDPSGFDLHVTGAHHRALASVYSEYWPRKVEETWSAVHHMPVAGPPLRADAGAFLYERPEGGTQTSGIITTTIDDILINGARVLESVAAGFKVGVLEAERMRRYGQWSAYVWGDDTLLIVPARFDYARYVERSLELGFPTAAGPEPVLLMTYFDVRRRTFFPLASRVFQNTVGRERGGKSAAIELFGLFMRSWRSELNPFGSLVWRELLTGDSSLSHYRVRTREELGNLVAGPLKAQLLAELKETPDIVRDMIAMADRAGVHRESVVWLQRTFGLEWSRLEGKAYFTPEWSAYNNDAGLRESALRALRWLATPERERGETPALIKEQAT